MEEEEEEEEEEECFHKILFLNIKRGIKNPNL